MNRTRLLIWYMILLSALCFTADAVAEDYLYPWYSGKRIDLSKEQRNESGFLAYTDSYGTEIIFQKSTCTYANGKITMPKGGVIRVRNVNSCVNGLYLTAATKISFKDCTFDGINNNNNSHTTSGSYINKFQWKYASSDIKITLPAEIIISAIRFSYDLTPQLWINGKRIKDYSEIYCDQIIQLDSYIHPEESYSYQYRFSVSYLDDEFRGWRDVDANNCFSPGELAVTDNIPLLGYADLDIKTRTVIYPEDGDVDYIEYYGNDMTIIPYYLKFPAPIPAEPKHDLTVDENNSVNIDDEEITFTLRSEENTTIWFKVSNPKVLKVRSRSGEINEEEYEDSGTNEKSFTLTGPCELSYFSKHTETGNNSAVTTLSFTGGQDTNRLTDINGGGAVRYYDLSGRPLMQAPAFGPYIMVSPSSAPQIRAGKL